MEQLALDSARLVQWTKGFDVEGVMGKDVVALLQGGRGFGMFVRFEKPVSEGF
jgi:hexokinase